MELQEVNSYYEQLLKLLDKDKLFKNADLNLPDFARRLKLHPNRLSYVVNRKVGVNFQKFINQFRIKEAKQMLESPAYQHYSLLGIGLEAGFNSKSNFYATFKKETGKTPKAYQEAMVVAVK